MKKIFMALLMAAFAVVSLRAEAPIPAVSGFTPASGVVGASVTLTGTNFSSIAASNIVYFGAVQAGVVSASATNLVVTVPVGATYAPITVTVAGLVAFANQSFMPTFAGNGSGISTSSFAPRQDLASVSGPVKVVPADIDGDGKPDLIVANTSSSSLSIYQNLSTNGSLTAASFAAPVNLATPSGTQSPYNLAVADVDGDGKLDIIATDFGDNLVSIYRNIGTSGNISSNSFAARVDFATGTTPIGVEVRDIDGDGKLDILVANNGAGTVSILRNTGVVGSLTTNSFAPKVDITTGSGCGSIVVGDLDGDGQPDVATANSGSSTVSLLRNLSSPGNITFATKVDFATANYPIHVTLVDLDGDGKQDLAVGCYLSKIFSVFRNISSAGSLTTNSFASRIDCSLNGRSHTTAIGDLDGDGKPDLTMVTELNNQLSVFRNVSTPGSFTNSSLDGRVDFSTGNNPWGVTVGDLDGDGRPDIIFGNFSGSTLSIYKNLVSFGGAPQITSQPANQTVQIGGNANFTVTAGGTLPLSYQWSFNGTNLVGATNSTLTLTNVQSSQAGDYAVSITNSYGSTVGSNAALSVVLTVDHFVFGPIASPQSANQPFGVTVTAKNAFNETATNFTGTVSLQVSGTGGIGNGVAILNGGFETGTLTNWTVVGTQTGQFVTDNGATIPPGASGTIAPYVGSYSALGKASGPGSFYMYQDVSIPSGVSAATLNWAHCVRNYYSSFNSNQTFQVRICDTNYNVLATAFTASPGDTLLGGWVQTNYDLTGFAGQKVRVTFWVVSTYFYIDAYVDNISLQLPANLTLTPTNTTNFVNGVWNGNVAVQPAASSVVLTANDGSSHNGSSNPFNVIAPPTITAQPTNQTVNAGGVVVLIVAADGTSPLSYQWKFNDTNLVGATNATLTMTNAQSANGGAYSVVVSNLYGSIVSSNAVLTVLTYPPTITTQPTNQTVNAGNPATFIVVAGGTSPLSYQWIFNGTNINYATNAALILVNAQPVNSGVYSVVVSNFYGLTVSSNVVLTVLTYPPVITQQPTNQTTYVGGSAAFSAAASGTAPLSYQWQFNGTNLVGATNVTLTLTNIQPTQSGSYALQVANVAGAAFSSNVVLTVNPRPPVPVVSGFTPASGVVGASVTLTGTNFSSIAASNIVYFGAVRATVVSASPTNLVVTVPVGATFAPITVMVEGLVAYAPALFLPIFSGGGALSSSSLSGPANLTTGDGPVREVIGDLDGDGKADLVEVNTYDGSVWIYHNVSTNSSLTSTSFALPVVFTIGGGVDSIYGLALADLDGDGRLDIVTANRSLNIVSIFKNLGLPGSLTTNSFAARVDFPVAGAMVNVAVRDLDGDGRPEIVTANSSGNTVSVLRNLGVTGIITTNSFSVPVNFATGGGPFGLVIADIDGDGQPDLVVANTSSSASSLSVLRNTSTFGNVLFAPKVDFAGLGSGGSVAVGDLDGDGKLDVVYGSQSSGQAVSLYRNTSTPGSITTNSLSAHVDFAMGGWANSVAIGDLDGDGKPDLLVAVQLPSRLSIFRNISTPGSLTTSSFGARIDFASGWNPNGLAIGDLDGDGRSDVVFGNSYDDTVSIYRNTNPFANPPIITTQPADQIVVVGHTASFNVAVTGSGLLGYQWSCNGTNLAGATNATLTLANVQVSQAGNYSVLVTNALGSTNSSSALLTVVLPPTITQQPQSQAVLSYGSASFTVAATGTGPLSYQWRKNGVSLNDGGNISGSTTTNLNLVNVALADAGNYDVVVSNPYATSNSLVAVLTVLQTALAIGSTNGMSGSTLTVPVFMNAVGVENTFLASAGYDAGKLVLQGVQLGQATVGAYLQEVDTQTNSGNVGFAILLDYGAVIPAGTQEVARLVFKTLPVTNNVTTSLTFSDSPTARQLYDNDLNLLPATYQGGTIFLTPAEYAADVFPRTNGDHQVSVQDWLEVGRMVAGLDVVTNSDEMLRADCAPRGEPNGVLTVADWVQAGRYALGLDSLTLVTPPILPPMAMLGKSNFKVVPQGASVPNRALLLGNVSAGRGQTVDVPVLLVCDTNENAVGMTVVYNTNQLKFISASLGSTLAGGRLNVNTNLAPNKVGVALAMSPGSALAAGTNQVAVLQFLTRSNASGTVPLTLDSSVIQLEVSDKTAIALAANYVNGSVVLPLAPTLQAHNNTGNSLQLTWPVSSGAFVVQSAGSLAGPWSDTATLTIITNGSTATITVPATNQQQFYRLVGQ